MMRRVLLLFAAVLAVAALLAFTGCATATAPSSPTAPTLVPGALNQFDSDTYRALAATRAFIAQAASNASVLTATQKVLLNQLVTDINAADLLYAAYHAGTATQAAMQASLTTVQTDQSKYAAGVQ